VQNIESLVELTWNDTQLKAKLTMDVNKYIYFLIQIGVSTKSIYLNIQLRFQNID
jgi:hypothetical protein